MTDYVKSTNFASKDSLAVGNPLKIVKGTELDAEFNNIVTAVATKADTSTVNSALALKAPINNASLTGTTSVQTVSFSSGGWTVTETSGTLYFKHNGTNKAALDSDGNLTVIGNITAYGTL